MKEQVENILKLNIKLFKNITIRRDASLTSQLTKVLIFYYYLDIQESFTWIGTVLERLEKDFDLWRGWG